MNYAPDRALAASVSLRSRAAQTLVLFVTPAVAAIVVVAPQPRTGVGVELLVLAAISGAALFVLDRRAGHDSQSGVAWYVERAQGAGRGRDGGRSFRASQ